MNEQIEELRRRADIVEVVGSHLRLRQAGRNYVGLCPFHREKTPSFTVSPERGFFHCFGCGVGGTVFDFVMRMEGATFAEAARLLAARYGVALEPPRGGGPGADQRAALLAANQAAGEFFARALWEGAEAGSARAYLKKRGIAEAAARAFALGFAASGAGALADFLKKRGLFDAALRAGLLKSEGDAPRCPLGGRLIFPIRDSQGSVRGFGGRVLDERLPKYLNSPESPAYSKSRTLYGLYEARQAIVRDDRIILVEGYLDALSLWQAGLQSVVASLGTSLTAAQLGLAAHYTRNIVACFDGDAAGRKASLRALELSLEAELLLRGVFLPSGLDPDSLVHKEGAAAVLQRIEAAEPLLERFVKEWLGQFGPGLSSLEVRERVTRRVVELLRPVPRGAFLDLVARRAAALLGVGEDALLSAPGLSERRARPAPPAGTGGPSAPRDAALEAEVGLLALAIAYPEMRPEVLAEGPSALLADPASAALLEEVCRSTAPARTLGPLVALRLPESKQALLSRVIVSLGGTPDQEADRAKAEYEFHNPDFKEVDQRLWRAAAGAPAGLSDSERQRSRAFLADYVTRLTERRRTPEIAGLLQSARQPEADGAKAAQQALMALRRTARKTKDR